MKLQTIKQFVLLKLIKKIIFLKIAEELSFKQRGLFWSFFEKKGVKV